MGVVIEQRKDPLGLGVAIGDPLGLAVTVILQNIINVPVFLSLVVLLLLIIKINLILLKSRLELKRLVQKHLLG